MSSRRWLSVAVACFSLPWALDAPVSGQAAPQAPADAAVLRVALHGPPPPVPPAVVSRDPEVRVTLRATGDPARDMAKLTPRSALWLISHSAVHYSRASLSLALSDQPFVRPMCDRF